MFNIAGRFANYSLGKTTDPAIDALVGGQKRGAVDITGLILGSIANEGIFTAQNLNQTAQARFQAQQFQNRIVYDLIGLGLDAASIGILGLPEAAAIEINNLTTGLWDTSSILRDYTTWRADSVLGEGTPLNSLPQQDQNQIMAAVNQYRTQDVSIYNITQLLETAYSKNNLPDYKNELDNYFEMAGQTTFKTVMSPYISTLNSSYNEATVLSLSQWMGEYT
jgi:hypothetical protein